MADLFRRLHRSAILPGLVSSYANTAVGIICSFVAIPLYLRWLGGEQYGLWIAVSGIVGYLGLLNLGVVQTVSNLFGTAVARGDNQAASRVLATGLWNYARVSGLAAGGVLLLVRVLPWSVLIKGSSGLQHEGRSILTIAALGFLVELPLSVFGGALRAIGGIRQQQQNGVVQNIARIGVAFGYLAIGGGLRGLVVALSAVNVATAFLNLFKLRGLVPGLQMGLHLRDADIARRMRAPSFFFLLLQVGGAIAFSTDALVISARLGTANVTAYSIAQRLTFVPFGLVTAISANYGPLFLQAYSAVDGARLSNLYRQCVRVSVGAGTAFVAILLASGPAFIRVWVGPANYVGLFPFSVMVGLTFIQMLLSPADALLSITARHRAYAVAVVWEALLNLGLSLWLVGQLGVGGVALASLIARVFGAGPVMLVSASRLCRLARSERSVQFHTDVDQ